MFTMFMLGANLGSTLHGDVSVMWNVKTISFVPDEYCSIMRGTRN